VGIAAQGSGEVLYLRDLVPLIFGPMAEALSAGSRLGSYRIEGVIGRGGMGVVYRATQERLGRPVAVKVIAPELARDPTFRRRFDRESELAASIEHPNAVPIYEAGESADGTLYIAMRLIEGTDLAALLAKEGWLEPDRAARLVEQVAGALDEAHRRGLVHRDVKPSNVLIGDAGDRDWAYLTDFGLTKRTTGESRLTGSGEWVGTLDYVSPEQIQGQPIDARTDVYSLGCVLFEAVTARAPFEREDQVATIHAHLNERPPSLGQLAPDAPGALQPVIDRALAKDPKDRYPSAGDLGRAAASAVAGIAITEPERTVARGEAASGTAPTRRLGRPPGGRAGRGARQGAAIVAVLLIAGLAVGLVSLIGGDGHSPSVVATIPVGDRPLGITVGEGSVWVADQDDGTVTRIDPETARAAGDPIEVGAGPSGVRTGGGLVWVTNQKDDTVTRIDPRSGSVVGRPIDVGARPSGIKIGDGYVWVANVASDNVTRLDPSSAEKVDGTIPVGHSPAGVAIAAGSVWIANSQDGTVTRIASGSGSVVGTPIRVGARPRGMTDAEGSIWVANSLDGSVSRIDPLSPQAVGRATPVGRQPAGIAAGEGFIWVANERDGTVSRIDPDSAEVVGDPIDVGSHPRGIAVGGGSVWVANSADDSVTRIEP
jgi:YVTN family beta-propeller protein